MKQKKPLLRWTGHPLADVGVATLCAMVGKNDPEKLTLEDLDEAGKEIKSAYTDSVMTSYLTCVYMNAPYVQPKMRPEEFKKKVDRLTIPHRVAPDSDALSLRCVFSGEPATLLLKRSEMPMIMGEGYFNFYPAGVAGVPVAASYGIAIHALALGGRRSEGKLLIVHCDDPKFTLQFVRRFLKKNREIINLSQADRLPSVDDPDNVLDRELPGGLNKEKRPKYPDAKAPSTLLMADLVEIVSDKQNGNLAKSPTSITAYHMSNSGQGPSLAIMHIPGEFVEFLFSLQSPDYRAKWNRLVARSWRAGKGGGDIEDASGDAEVQAETPVKKGKKKPKAPAPVGAGKSRNELYNDLMAIFEDGFCNWMAATRFIRRHLLSSDPTSFYLESSRAHRGPRLSAEQLELIDWQLTALFLEKVLGMDKKRIELIKEFATRLADLISEHNDRRLFRELVFTDVEWQYRAILAKVQRQYAKDRGKLALGFDEYVDVFLNTEPGARQIWSLVRDLISIRLVERLFELKFFDNDENREALVTASESGVE